MVADPLLALPPAPCSGRPARVEYLDFQDIAEHRVFRLRVHGPDGWTERRVRIASPAFAVARVRLQDGPDVCYQALQRAVAAGEAASLDVITIGEVDLATYRELHTPAAKHRSGWTPSPSLPTPVFVPRKQARPPSPQPPVPPDTDPALEQGQRVSHAVYGVGVTTSSIGGHTVVRFDGAGPKTFVTSLLEVEVLSAPHTWETTPRGNNRPCLPNSAL